MIIDNTAGLQFFLTEDIYLLKQDKDNLGVPLIQPVIAASEPDPAVQQQAIAPAIAAQTPALHFNHLGSNAKQFLILCSYAGAAQMDDKHLTALTSALQRKELDLADVAILNIASYGSASINQLHQYFSPTRLLLLGAPCLLNGWDNLALNQLQNLGGIKALYTYSFTEMLGDRDKTKAFWEQMKVL